MNKKVFRSVFALLCAMLLMFTVFAPCSFAFIGVDTPPMVNTFVPMEIEVSDLILKKTVEHPFEVNYHIPDNIAFDYLVEFGPLYAGFTFNTSAGEIKADELGRITVPVRPNVNFGIEGVDEGTVVTVTELQKEGDGFTPKDGVVTKQTTIKAGEAVTVEFVNIYEPLKTDAGSIKVSGTKNLQGRPWKKSDQFTFKLEYNGGKGWIGLGTGTVDDLKADHTFDFTSMVSGLEFEKAGEYQFRMVEIPGSEANMTYDATVNSFTVAVHDPDMDGKLQIVSVKGKNNTVVTFDDAAGTYSVGVTFSNVYVAPPVITPNDIVVPLAVKKTVKNEGKLSIGPEDFKFQLKSVDTGEKVVRTSDKKGDAVFNLGFSAADIGRTYRFELSEINTNRANVTYDKKVYELRITIELSENNTLVARIKQDGKEVESSTFAFTNTYRAGDGQSPDTGDHTNTNFYLILVGISAGAILLLLIFRKKIQNFLD